MVGTTRTVLRQMIGRKLGDLRLLTASVAGSTTTFSDSLSLTDSDSAYRGTEWYGTGGTPANLGVAARVVDSQQASTTLTLTPPLPAAPQLGDTADLVNLRGEGWRIQHYHNAINDVLLTASPDWLFKEVEYLGTYSMDTPTLPLPSTMTHIYRVEYQDTNGDWREVPRAKRAGVYGQGWWPHEAEGTLGIEGRFRDAADQYQVRVWGYAPARPLLSDGDTTAIPPAWIVAEAAAAMAFSRGERDWVAKGQAWQQEAHDIHPRGSTMLAPGTIKVTV